MSRLVPDFILRQALEGKHSGRMEVIAVSIDLIGFTAITQAFMKHTHAGAEALTDTIHTIFTPAISALETRGGCISGFAGDAFTALFEAGRWPQALSAAWEVRNLSASLGRQKTEYGDYELAVRIGIGAGEASWEIIPNPVQTVYWFCGPGIERAVSAQALAHPNEIVCCRLPDSIRNSGIGSYATISDEHCKVTGLQLQVPLQTSRPEPLPQDAFVPESVARLMVEGEFRDLLSCFINLRDSDARQRRQVTDAAIAHGGYISHIDCTDKGWLMYVIFGAPKCYDQNRQRAMIFALDLLSSHGAGIRIGLSEGKAYAGFVGSASRREYTGMGKAVNLAARMMLKAEWGQVWFDQALQASVGHEFEYEALGNISYKGYSQPLETFRLLTKRLGTESGGFGNRFIGRREELERLESSCAGLFEGGFAGLSYLYGAAGQGKSRLLYELRQNLGDRVHAIILQADAIHPVALGPFAAWLRNQFTKSVSGPPEERVSDFRKSWAAFCAGFTALPDAPQISSELNRIESLLAGLIGLEWEGGIYSQLEPQDRSSLVQMAIRSLIEIMCRLRPVLLIVEDLHWLDPDSAELITLITRKASATALKLIVTSRPRDDGSKPDLRLDRDVRVDAIELEGLSLDSIRALMNDILSRPASPELLDYVQSRSLGNPFIVAQLTMYLQETGSLAVREGHSCLQTSTDQMPDSVEAILIARIDRLETELKSMVQTASVLGYEFSRVILASMLEHALPDLADLKPERFEYKLLLGESQRVWNAVSEIGYIFSHSLLRDAAYGMQLLKQLRHLHLYAAQVIRDLYAGDKPSYSTIAFHYAKAGEAFNAADYYLKAGDYERDAYHCAQALEYYQAAKALTASLWGTRHPGYAKCLSRIGSAYTVNSEYDLALPYFQEALAIQEETVGKDHPDTANTLSSLGLYHGRKGHPEQALSYYQQALAIRQRHLGRVHADTASVINNLGNLYCETGRYDLAMEHYEQALSIRSELWGDMHPQIATSYHSIGNLHWSKGEYSTAMEYYQKALNIRLEILGPRHPETADSLSGMGDFYSQMGQFDQALRHYQQALATRLEIQGSRHTTTADCLNNIGITCDIMGEYAKALQHLDQAIQIKRQLFGDQHVEVAAILNNIGSVYDHQGQYDLALQTHQQALPIWEEALGRQHAETATCLNNIGCAYENMGENDTAMGYYQQAYAIYSEVLGPNRPETSTALVNIGCIHENKQDYASAIDFYKRALAIRTEVFGPNHPATQRTKGNIERLEMLVRG